MEKKFSRRDFIFKIATPTGIAALLWGFAPAVAKAVTDFSPASAPFQPTFESTAPATMQADTSVLPRVDVDQTTQQSAPEMLVTKECILPFEGASMEGGLQFFDVIYNRGEPERDKETGNILHHLGLDFKGGNVGDMVVSVCDGTLVYAGKSLFPEPNLGNIVVIEYIYEEDGSYKKTWMFYAHLGEDILNGVEPGAMIYKGQRIGSLGYSGGWGPEHVHLHVHMMTERGIEDLQEDARWNFQGDMARVYGRYREEWDKGMVYRDFIDPKPWFLKMMGF